MSRPLTPEEKDALRKEAEVLKEKFSPNAEFGIPIMENGKLIIKSLDDIDLESPDLLIPSTEADLSTGDKEK